MTLVLLPFAKWLPVVNETPGGEDSFPMGLVLHITQGGAVDPYGWFNNPKSQVSSHAWDAPDGTLEQYVSLTDKAWAECDGNAHWISLECAGMTGQPLTKAQVFTAGVVYAFGVMKFGWPLQISDSPNTRGLGWHGMGGAAWGSHPDCPGAPVLAQRPAILAVAASLLKPPAPAPSPVVVVPLNPELGGPVPRVIVPVKTDSNGNGAVILDGGINSAPGVASLSPAVDMSKVVFWGAWGSDPAVDNPPYAKHGVAAQDRGGHPLVTVWGADPNATVLAALSVTA